jgi:hypothetical protein
MKAGDNNEKKPSEAKVRMKIQELLEKNMRPSTGMFGAKELSERNFVNDLFKHLDIEIKKI